MKQRKRCFSSVNVNMNEMALNAVGAPITRAMNPVRFALIGRGNIMANMLGFQQQQKMMEESDGDCEELLRPVVFVFSHKKKV